MRRGEADPTLRMGCDSRPAPGGGGAGPGPDRGELVAAGDAVAGDALAARELLDDVAPLGVFEEGITQIAG